MSTLLTLLCTAVALHAQMPEPIKCTTSWKVVNDSVAELRIAATIDDGWHLYSTGLEDGPTAAKLVVEAIEGVHLSDALRFEGQEIAKYDDMFGMEVRYFEHKVTFVQRFIIERADYKVQGYFQYGACNDENCMPPTDVAFAFPLATKE